MTVQELIDQLRDIPSYFDIIIAADSEGNDFSPLADWSAECYRADSSWSGTLVRAEDEEDGYFVYEDEDSLEDDDQFDDEEVEIACNAVVFWPTM